MKRALYTVAVLVLLGLGAVAQGQEEEKKTEELGRREQMTLRSLGFALGLSNEQKEQLKGILLKASKSTDEGINGILTDDQKKKYKDMKSSTQSRRSAWGGRSGRGGGRGGGMMGGMMGGRGGMMGGMGDMAGTLEEWKKRLNLDEKQSKKIEKIFAEITEEAMAKFMEKLPEAMGSGGRPDFRKILKDLKPEIDKMLDRAQKKIAKELREDQLPEFEKIMKEFREKITGFMDGNRSSRRPSRGDSSGRRLDRILRELALPADEAEIIKPKIEAIVKLQSVYQTAFSKVSTDLRKLMKDGAEGVVVKEKLDGIRQARDKYEAELKALQQDLRDLLTYEQEAKLVLHRVLQ
jgi:hypothetical protein